MILYFDGKNTIMCQNASQIMIDLIFIRSYQMQSFWQKIPLYPLILSVKLRYEIFRHKSAILINS